MISRLSVLATILAVALAYPVPIRRQATLDPQATAEAQQRDDTATRAFTAVQIATGTGQCLFVDPLSGDFRENLTPVQAVACDASSDGQKWDVITQGKHQDTPGQALIVSSLTNACMNFDGRRAAGNQVLLFSCGGRADGGGAVTNSQQFAFDGSSSTIPLVPANQAGACLVVNGQTGLLDANTKCDASNPGAAGTFSFGGASSAGGGGGNGGSGGDSGAASSSSSTPTSSSSTPPPAETQAATSSAAAANPHVTDIGSLDQAATDEAQKKDDTATRAFTASQIKTGDGQCLFVDPLSGDFRENLTPVQAVACDASSDGQKWDLITSGVHQDTPGQALIVSSLTNACMNFDGRRAAGNQVLLFSCGGRADGGGQVTNSQQFSFDGSSSTIAFLPANQAGACLVVNGQTGLLDVNTNCDTANPGSAGTFTFTGGAGAATGSGSVPATDTGDDCPDDEAGSDPAQSVTATPTASTPAATQAATSTAAAANPHITDIASLDQAATDEAQKKDNTATRAFTSTQIKTGTGQCLFVDPLSGDFRENLTPVQVVDCDASSDGQKWDVITEGVHQDTPGQALIVSSLTNACMNFDGRRAAGNQVLLFSCGGRADGGGQVTNSQQLAFDGSSSTIPFLPANQEGACLFVNQATGLLDINTDCDVANPGAVGTFTFA